MIVEKNWHDISLLASFNRKVDRKRVITLYKNYAKTAHPKIKIDCRRHYSNEIVIAMMCEMSNQEALKPQVTIEKLDKYNSPLHYKGVIGTAIMHACYSEWQAILGAHLVDMFYIRHISFTQLRKLVLNGVQMKTATTA